MNQEMSIAEMIKKTSDIIELFKQIEPRVWGVEAMAVELSAEVGTLTDTIMIQEGYRKLRPGTSIDLEDDIADILFMLIRIANHYGIDLEKAYRTVLVETRQKLEARLADQ